MLTLAEALRKIEWDNKYYCWLNQTYNKSMIVYIIENISTNKSWFNIYNIWPFYPIFNETIILKE